MKCFPCGLSSLGESVIPISLMDYRINLCSQAIDSKSVGGIQDVQFKLLGFNLWSLL